MGTISSGTGLISGLDIQSLVTQLIAIEARPLRLLETRIADVQKQQTAFLELNARLLSAKTALKRLSDRAAFDVRTATSSNENVLTAQADTTAPLGTFSFRVKRLVSTHQLVSGGFADTNLTPVGEGTIEFELGRGNLNATTRLSSLRGGEGARRGIIRITDRTGKSVDVDLRTAIDIDEVLAAINGQTQAAVRATASGDRLILTDFSGGTGTLGVVDIGGGHAAEDLGIAGTATAGDPTRIVGSDIVNLVDGTRLGGLNDGTGVHVNGLEDDLRIIRKDDVAVNVNLSSSLAVRGFGIKLGELNDGAGVRLGVIRITNRNGDAAEIDLTGATTLDEVKNIINAATLASGEALGVDVVGLAKSGLIVVDETTGTVSNLKIEDVTGHAAEDLGINIDTPDASFTSAPIYRLDSIGGVLRAVQYAVGNEDGAVTVSISADGNGLVLSDNSVGGGVTTVEALNGSFAARDLGLLGDLGGGSTLTTRHLVAGLNTVLLSSLKGGSGLSTGTVAFTLRDGSTANVDFSGTHALSEIIERINAVAGLEAQVDAGGTGIVIRDTTDGTGTLAVADVSGTTAADLGLTSRTSDTLATGSLQLKHVSETTKLADLRDKKGISFGSFQITASDGTTATVSLSQGTHSTIGDVLKTINATGLAVTARVNAHGDGIELVDEAGGAGVLTVTQLGSGSTAKDLGILGAADADRDGDNTILTGTFAQVVEIDSNDTLDEVVKKINAAGLGITAAVINDGTSDTPFRLTITSRTPGASGRVFFNTDATELGLNTLAEGKDAAIVLGDPAASNPIIVTGGSNTFTNLITGLTLNAAATSDVPVDISVDRDVDSVVNDVTTFVQAFNDTLDRIDELTMFVPDTNERGILLGDNTVELIRTRMYREVSRVAAIPDSELKRLSNVGITIGSGARLQFDEERFREEFEKDPEAVKSLFTYVEPAEGGGGTNVGFAARLHQAIDDLTNVGDGLLTQANNRLQQRVDLFSDQATRMQQLLDQKESRLYAQFQAMERALASLQAQQASLGALSSLASSLSSGALGGIG